MSSLKLDGEAVPADGGSPVDGDSEHGYFKQQSYNVVMKRFTIRDKRDCSAILCIVAQEWMSSQNRKQLSER